MPPELEGALLLERPAPAEFVTRFQQTTPPIMAKGVEDTAFYRYARLLALNEVGGDPERFGISVERFHARNRERARALPAGLLATMTHDTKRSGDVRARIGALARMPAEWGEHVARWRELNAPLRGGGRARRRRGIPALPDAGRSLADPGRAAGEVHAQGAARGEAQHQLAGAG